MKMILTATDDGQGVLSLMLDEDDDADLITAMMGDAIGEVQDINGNLIAGALTISKSALTIVVIEPNSAIDEPADDADGG